MTNYKQFDIVWTQFPLSDKVDTLKVRPAVIISNQESNLLDNDVIVCPITSKIRGDKFAILLSDEMLTNPLKVLSEIRCNKLMTIRNILIVSKSGEIRSKYHDEILEKIISSFQ